MIVLLTPAPLQYIPVSFQFGNTGAGISDKAGVEFVGAVPGVVLEQEKDFIFLGHISSVCWLGRLSDLLNPAGSVLIAPGAV